jgi:hypothetical protein
MINVKYFLRIIRYTNLEMNKVRRSRLNKGAKIVDYADLTVAEFKALIGLWLKLGITGFHVSSVKEIFSKKNSSSLGIHYL